MVAVFIVFMFILGAILGSFACCQARRLRFKEKAGKRSANASKPISPYGRRSICDHCHKQLKWYENIPIFSWLFLGGRCKKCHKKIGLTEFFSELGLALAFLALGFKFLPDFETSLTSLDFPWLSFARLLLIIIIFTALAICFIYDALWGLLPSVILYILLALSAIYLVLDFISLPVTASFSLTPNFKTLDIFSLLAGIGILPGIYYLLYFFSKEKLVGSGDWLLCLPFALVLHNFWLCFLVLFLANVLAVLIQFPATILSKKKSHQFPFGPFLITAFLIIYLSQTILYEIAFM